MADETKVYPTIAASPVVEDDGAMPRRIVIRDLGCQFVVHTECFPRDGTSLFYTCGNYFPHSMFADGDDRTAALRKAYTCFDRRARRTLHIGEDT